MKTILEHSTPKLSMVLTAFGLLINLTPSALTQNSLAKIDMASNHQAYPQPRFQRSFWRIFGTRANELSKTAYFYGLTIYSQRLEVMLSCAEHLHKASRLACNGLS